jgi:hypothetical protein
LNVLHRYGVAIGAFGARLQPDGAGATSRSRHPTLSLVRASEFLGDASQALAADESEQWPTRDAIRSAAAPLISNVSLAPSSARVRSSANPCPCSRFARRSGSRRVRRRGARWSSRSSDVPSRPWRDRFAPIAITAASVVSDSAGPFAGGPSRVLDAWEGAFEWAPSSPMRHIVLTPRTARRRMKRLGFSYELLAASPDCEP